MDVCKIIVNFQIKNEIEIMEKYLSELVNFIKVNKLNRNWYKNLTPN